MSWLEKLQEKQDKITYSIEFLKCPKFRNITEVISYALGNGSHSGMPDTRRISDKKHEPKQNLGHSRSIQDLHLLCKNYFPQTTVKDVANILRKKCENKKYSIWECETFRRPMFAKTNSYYVNKTDIERFLT
jgi:hypothetical protein